MKRLIIFLLLIIKLFASEDNNTFENKLESSNDFIIAKITYEQKKYNKSFVMFEHLFKKDSDNVLVNYYYGMSALALKKDDLAMAAFERVLIKEPTFTQARLEYARLLFTKGLKKESKVEFEKVLLSPIPKNVRANVEKFIKAINSEDKTKFLASIKTNIFYDDNLNNSFDSTISIPQTGDFSSKKDDAYGISLLALLSLTTPLNDKYSLNNSLFAYKKAHYDKEAYDISFFSYKPSFIINSSSSSAYLISLSLDKFVSGDNKNFIAYAIEGAYKKALIKNLGLSIGYGFKEFDYQDDKDLSFYSNKFFASLNYMILKLDSIYTINSDSQDTSRNDINKNIFENKISLNYNILKNTKISSDFAYTKTSYDDKISLYNKKREDKKHNFSIGLSQNLTKSSFMTFSFNYIKNESNIPIYSYEKELINVGYTRNFKW